MHRLSEIALAKRNVVLLLAVALFFGGLSSWSNLKQELLPDIELPVITVVAPYPGAGASDVAEQVTKPIERAISGVPRLERLQSTSANSIALVVAQFSFGTDVKATKATIEENVAAAGLPATVSPQVSALNINAAPVIVAAIAATSEDGLEAAATIARREIVPAVLALDGVASVDLTGGTEEQVVVTLDPDKLVAAGVSVGQVVGLLQANNLTIPSGQLRVDGERITVSTLGRFASLDELRNLVVGVRPAGPPGTRPSTGPGSVPSPGPAASPTPGASPAPAPSLAPGASPAPGAGPAVVPVRLGDLGTVETVAAPTTGFARTNGNPSLSLSVSKTTTANTVEVAEAVEATLAEIAARHPGELTITTVSDLSTFIEDSRDGLLREGGLGAVFAILTIFFFLSNLRSTAVAAISIPLSVLTALVAMEAAGITINVMTLGGLAVAVGRVVDDAIVVLENIYRHRALGEDRLTAALRGPREVATAITSATLTTVGVFLPIGFIGGIVSQFFLPFALTVTFALLASLVVALTVVPVLAYLFLDRVRLAVDPATGEPRNSLWVNAYAPTIRLALRNRWTKLGVLAIAATLFAGSLALVPSLPTQFINAGSEKILAVTVAPPAATSSEAVLARAEEAERLLLADPKVQLVATSVPGESDTGFQTIVAAQSGRPANSARLTVRLDPTVDLTAEAKRLSDLLAPIKTDGFDVAVAQTAGFTSNNLNIIVSAADPDLVATATETVLATIRDNPDLINVKSDLVKATPEIVVRVDPNKAIGVGLTAAQIGSEVRNALVGQAATRLVLGGGSGASSGPVELVVRLDPTRIRSVDDLRRLPVGTSTRVPLGSVASVEQTAVQGSITRIDEAPAASITAEITSQDTGAVSTAVQRAIDDLRASGAIPPGVDVRLAGVTQQQREAFGGLFRSMAVAVLIVYVMMVFAFNSFVTPFVILFSLPLATIGAFPALFLTGRPIGVSALIGFLMLIGIVVTNAIVLLDLVERLRREGLSTREALVEGGKIRVRPILMTAIATILALIPLAAGLNEGSIIAAELGTVVIGGLFSSTFLTLIVVPVVYSLVEGAKDRLRRSGRSTGEAAGLEAAPPVAGA